MSKIAGVLGLQGAYEKHLKMLNRLEIKSILIRYPEEINKCDGLVIPGGESSTMSKLIDQMHLRQPLLDYDRPILATCAGVILLSENKPTQKIQPLGKLPILCQRNAYGRQVESFTTAVKIKNQSKNFTAIFIRAPKISQLNSKEIEVLAKYDNSPILLQWKNILAATFHPELTDDTRIHEKFINLL